jgi:hypothetical protein
VLFEFCLLLYLGLLVPVLHFNYWLNLLILKIEMVASKLAESQKAGVCSQQSYTC